MILIAQDILDNYIYTGLIGLNVAQLERLCGIQPSQSL